MTIPASASGGLRRKFPAAPAMPPQSASSAPNCSRFELIWTIEPDAQSKSVTSCDVAQSLGHLFRQLAAAIRRRHLRLQKIRYPLVGVNLVLHLGEAVAFVFVNLVI